MSIGERIRKRREELGITQEELAFQLHYKSRSSINKIERGGNELTQKKITAIASALQTTPSYILGLDLGKVPEDAQDVSHKELPVLGDIPCGIPQPVWESEDHYSASITMSGEVHADFCLRAKGDSMINAGIRDGDMVLVRSQERVENGEIAVVIIDDESTLKRVYYNEETEEISLYPENPSYRPLHYRKEELDKIRILGRAISVHSPL